MILLKYIISGYCWKFPSGFLCHSSKIYRSPHCSQQGCTSWGADTRLSPSPLPSPLTLPWYMDLSSATWKAEGHTHFRTLCAIPSAWNSSSFPCCFQVSTQISPHQRGFPSSLIKNSSFTFIFPHPPTASPQFIFLSIIFHVVTYSIFLIFRLPSRM